VVSRWISAVSAKKAAAEATLTVARATQVNGLTDPAVIRDIVTELGGLARLLDDTDATVRARF
jgi:hypothetical protein